MPSATVDHMLIQVVGALTASVSLVLWLWIADTRRWWPFNQASAVQAIQGHRIEFQRAGSHRHENRRMVGWGDRRRAERAGHSRRGPRQSARELAPAM